MRWAGTRKEPFQMEQFQNRPLTEQVEENIFTYIQEKGMDVGDRLPNEYELARQFGVGRGTIREAIKSLVSKHVLEVRRGAGTFICNTRAIESDPLGISQMADRDKLAIDLLEVRLMLEPEIACHAAENAEAEDIEQLRAACRQVEEDIAKGIDHTEADIRFHTCVARCSKNRVVENLIPIINTSVDMFANMTNLELREETVETHRDVTEAIVRGDGIGAKYAMMMHLTYNRKRILEIIREKNHHMY